VTEEDLKNYADSARSLFRDIVRFCEARSDDRFPLTR
jgi:hypothetical protein